MPGIGPVLFRRSSRARRIIISVQTQNGVRVAVPDRTSFDSALEFVGVKKQWIRKHLVKIAENETQRKALAKSFASIDRGEAKRELTARLKQLAEKHGFTYSGVCIRNQRTRWGSCSRMNAISLNMKLLALPEDLIDYVILHELVHTRFHDHSKKFWAELEKHVKNARQVESRLKDYDTRWT